MTLTAGTRLGPYEILSALGAGGMGEVYRARDTKLGREVAIKVLPESLAFDPERVARFEREAKVLASLNHPHIAALHGMEEAGGQHFLIMELVEGETLAERIARGALPVDEALRLALQIAEALEAAHEKGIIHRDLKPANIKVTPDDKVKVLDFGLARALDPAGAGAAIDVTHSPTLSVMATQAGMILGTAAYMSPEQAKGRPVDQRADIFAFGCVLYELLSGRPPFEGDDVTEILGRVVTAEPDWSRLPTQLPPAVRRLLRRALRKEVRHRLADVRDARLELEEAGLETEPAAAVVPRARSRAAWAVSGLLALLAIAAAGIAWRPALVLPEMRVEINTPGVPAGADFEIALSPDGRHVAFVAVADGVNHLWVRSLEETDARVLPGTERAYLPFWSPDSRSLGFFASGRLRRVEVSGGAPRDLATAPAGRGGSWSPDGTILFAPTGTGPIWRVSASGGEPAAVTTLGASQENHRSPFFLPDGRRFLYLASSADDQGRIYLTSLDGGEVTALAPADTGAEYLGPNHVVFMRQGALLAQAFDAARGELGGEPSIVADGVDYGLVFSKGAFSVSTTGLIVYRRSSDGGDQQLHWYERSGKRLAPVGTPETMLQHPDLSPDGRFVAGHRVVQNNADVWLLDLIRGGQTRVTFQSVGRHPAWSPDGSRLAFTSSQRGANDLYVTSASGAGGDELVLQTPNAKILQHWSSDGRFLLYYEVDPETARDLWAVDLTGGASKPVRLAGTPFNEVGGQFSPDGRWVAYVTDESGRLEVVVQPFPVADRKWQVSTDGGGQPRWRPDGRELYFIAPDGTLMAAAIAVAGSVLDAGRPVALMPTAIVGRGGHPNKAQYAVSRDGRFLINETVGHNELPPLTLVLNWTP